MVASAPSPGIQSSLLAGRPVPLGRPGSSADNRPRFVKPSRKTRVFLRPVASSDAPQSEEESREETLARGMAVGALFQELLNKRAAAAAPLADDEEEKPRASGIIGAIVAAATMVRP